MNPPTQINLLNLFFYTRFFFEPYGLGLGGAARTNTRHPEQELIAGHCPFRQQAARHQELGQNGTDLQEAQDPFLQVQAQLRSP